MPTPSLPNIFVANTTAKAAEVNANFNELVDVLNQNLDDDNYSDAAMTASAKIAAQTVTEAIMADNAAATRVIADDAVTNDKIADGAVDAAAKILNGILTFNKCAAGSYMPQIATGAYEGDGNATQAITKLGPTPGDADIPFEPKGIIVYRHANAADVFIKTDQDTTFAKQISGGNYVEDQIISFEATPRFTIGDGTGGGGNYLNILGEDYTFIIWTFV